ncbi:MAG: hypothetical protein ACRDPF_11645 [Streptosporangiaceae bacterium]
MLVDPVAGPPEAESVGLVLAPPGPGELDVGVAGVEEPLPGVDEDAVAWGLAFVDDVAVPAERQGAGVALADAVPFPLVPAVAEALEVAMLMAVALVVPGAGAVAVVVSPRLVLPLPGLSLVPPTVALPDGLLTELAGVLLGVADVVGLATLAGADDAEPGGHTIVGTPPWAAEVPPPAPPAAELIGVPPPFVL